MQRVRINFDRAGRSEGTATVTYQYLEDAREAIREFNGANAKGQPIRLTLLPAGGHPKAERPKSLFERIERPRDRIDRSLSPEEGDATGGDRRRRRGGEGGKDRTGGVSRRSDTSKPAPDHIDRYVPGKTRSPTRRNQMGRRPGERRDDRRNRDGRKNVNGGSGGSGPRPKKTQEELDAEMDDYWGNSAAAAAAGGAGGAEDNAAAGSTAAVAVGGTAPAAATAAATANDDDIDMIE